MVRHQISQTSGVRIRPLARMERGFVSKSVPGCRVVFVFKKISNGTFTSAIKFDNFNQFCIFFLFNSRNTLIHRFYQFI